jgi:ABC-2 type transport system ATP-binding protein
VIAIESLAHRYGDVVAVDGISFSVARGEMFGLIGPDGAGKTTTLKMVLGLLKAQAGSIATCGLDPWKDRRALSHRVGYLSQRFSLYGDLSVDENISFFAQVHGVRRWRPRRDELLDLLRMAPFRKRLADRLSGGMKQKLALACTLIHTPELLVLDEPTTGVDPVSRRDFWKILVSLQRDGLTILLTTPYLDEAERCQRVGPLDHGRLLVVDAPDAIRASARGSVIEILATPRRLAVEALQARPGLDDLQTFGERLHASFRGVSPAGAPELAASISSELTARGIEVASVRAITPSLEDIFIARLAERSPGAPTGAAS